MSSPFTTTVGQWIVSSVLLFPLIGVASGQHSGGAGGMGGMGGSMGGFGWWPLLWSLILLGVAVLVVSRVYRSRRSRSDGPEETKDALSTLRTRYANGELSDEAFEERRRRLEE